MMIVVTPVPRADEYAPGTIVYIAKGTLCGLEGVVDSRASGGVRAEIAYQIIVEFLDQRIELLVPAAMLIRDLPGEMQ